VIVIVTVIVIGKYSDRAQSIKLHLHTGVTTLKYAQTFMMWLRKVIFCCY
jgi:hypothetical protein